MDHINGCLGDIRLTWKRREWLRLGSLAGLYALTGSRPEARAVEATATDSAGFGRAKSVILVVASGGQSQIDTWDPKPNAPREVRGAFDSIATSVPGVRFCEHMPRIARLADRMTVVRSMSHEDLDHGSAFYLMMTGRYHRRRSSNPLPSSQDYPGYGSLLQRIRPQSSFVKPAVHVNGPAYVPNVVGAGQFGGFLGKRYDPFTLGDIEAQATVVPGLEPQPEVPEVRLDARQSLLARLEGQARSWDDSVAVDGMAGLYRQAFEMLDRPQTRNAFRIQDEPDAIRDRYGRNRSGQACLMARRLVEAGCPLVTVIWNHNNRGQDHEPEDPNAWGWDTHNDIFAGLQDYLLPRFDQSFSALLEDLEERGLLEETLVVCLGEFGRAPLVALERNFAGASPGRKHWGAVYSIALAGAGVTPGQVVGASDRLGAYPASDSYGPWDTMATVFSALGIPPDHHYTNLVGQPLRLTEGRVIEAVYR